MCVPKTVCVLLRQPPYGSLVAAEAVRHLSGALANGQRAVGLLVDDGVYLARPGQQAAGGWLDLSRALANLLALEATDDSGEARRAVVLVHEPSLRERGLEKTELVPGCRVVDESEMAAVLGQADATLVY
jgi:sulfur relay (sulfurtransferase) DsrF/TusC family protein